MRLLYVSSAASDLALLRKRVVNEPTFVYKGHLSPILCVSEIVSMSDTGRKVFLSGDAFGTVLLWDASKASILAKLQCSQNEGILRIEIAYPTIWIHIRNGAVLQAYISATPLELLIIDEFRCGDCCFCPLVMLDEEHALLPSLKGPEFLDIWNLSTKTIVCKDVGWHGSVMYAKIFEKSRGSILLAAYDDGTIRSYSMKPEGDSYQVMQEWRLKLFNMTATTFDYDIDSDTLVAGGPETRVVIVQKACTAEPRIAEINIANEGISHMKLTEWNGELMVLCGGWDGKLRICAVNSATQIALINVHSDAIQALSIGTGAQIKDPVKPGKVVYDYCLCASSDGIISLWSLEDIFRQIYSSQTT